MATGKALATETRPYEKLVSELADLVSLNGDQGEGFGFSIAAEVVDNIMAAETIDDVFAANDAGPADISAFLNIPLNLTNAVFFKSQEKYKANGLGAYVVIDAVTDAGELVKLSTGAPNVVASIRRIQHIKNFTEAAPLRCKINGKETANGTLYTLGKAA